MKKFFATVLLFSSVFMFAPNASALNSAVYFEGGADNFVFYPGTSWSDVDLFDGFKNVMPGDKLTETVKVRNTAPEYDYVKIYLRADSHDESANPLSDSVADKETVATMSDFLSQLSMRVYNGGQLIYNATPDKLDGLKENVLLGEFVNGASTTLTVELTVPKTLGNKYAHRAGEVDWIFTAEGFKDNKPCNCPTCCDCQQCDNNGQSGTNTDDVGRKPKPLPNNAITVDNILRFVVLFIVSAVGAFLAIVLIRRYLRKEKE
ncbi:MAG: hypothetical protein K6F57_02080 [Candidatus Saccharibacteria bacterium]|nr:hypothetical protein [Candidatus Saccharibacteria bacterium]